MSSASRTAEVDALANEDGKAEKLAAMFGGKVGMDSPPKRAGFSMAKTKSKTQIMMIPEPVAVEEPADVEQDQRRKSIVTENLPGVAFWGQKFGVDPDHKKPQILRRRSVAELEQASAVSRGRGVGATPSPTKPSAEQLKKELAAEQLKEDLNAAAAAAGKSKWGGGTPIHEQSRTLGGDSKYSVSRPQPTDVVRPTQTLTLATSPAKSLTKSSSSSAINADAIGQRTKTWGGGKPIHERVANTTVQKPVSPSKSSLARRATVASNVGSGDKCPVCGRKVYEMEKTVVDGDKYHKWCFKCTECSKTLSSGNYAKVHGKPYCKPHFAQLFKTKGNYDEGFGEVQRKRDWGGTMPGDEPSREVHVVSESHT